jgi:hypothetical protein
MVDVIRGREKFLKNEYDIKKSRFEITIKETVIDMDLLSRRNSNIEEFFDVIDW